MELEEAELYVKFTALGPQEESCGRVALQLTCQYLDRILTTGFSSLPVNTVCFRGELEQLRRGQGPTGMRRHVKRGQVRAAGQFWRDQTRGDGGKDK